MIKFGNNVQDTTTTTGTGNLTLSGTAPAGCQSFNAGIGVGPSFFYRIENAAQTEWEDGLGHLSASTTFVRDVVYLSSNSNNLVSFSAGTKTVTNTIGKEQMLMLPTQGMEVAWRAAWN